ncbi:hypothetical protein AAG906_007457 [Vitis piasezkii]
MQEEGEGEGGRDRGALVDLAPLEPRRAFHNYVGEVFATSLTRDGDIQCLDVDDGDERVIIVTDGRYLVELEVNKGLSGGLLGHILWAIGVGESSPSLLKLPKGVDSRERSYCRVPDGVLVAWKRGEFVCLPRGFVELSNCLGIPISGYEKEISCLLRKLESKKSEGVKVFGGRRKSLFSSRLGKEIRRLECSVNYNSALSIEKGKRKSVGS